MNFEQYQREVDLELEQLGYVGFPPYDSIWEEWYENKAEYFKNFLKKTPPKEFAKQWFDNWKNKNFK